MASIFEVFGAQLLKEELRRKVTEAKIGVIGGSGLYNLDELKLTKELTLTTPFGDPSDNILIGSLSDVPVAFLPRHGRGHTLNPSEIPARANIFALKSIGVERLISISAVGSLKEEIHPMDMVIPDQLLDRTKCRVSTFFEEGIVAHISFADPFCKELSDKIATVAEEIETTIHTGGTYVVIEGPAFSTRAESNLYRSWGASVIGMTALPEAKLAREAGLCFTILACATDYDVWHPSQEDVTVETVIYNLGQNVKTSQSILSGVIPRLTGSRTCNCGDALSAAIVTARKEMSKEALVRLGSLIGDN